MQRGRGSLHQAIMVVHYQESSETAERLAACIQCSAEGCASGSWQGANRVAVYQNSQLESV